MIFLLFALSRFVKGKRAGKNTQYDIDDADLDDMDRCRGIVVASAIFGTALSNLL